MKYTFILKGLDLKALHERYNIHSDGSIENITEIKTMEISYMDDSKRIHKCVNSVVNLESAIKYNCFWCKNSFSGEKITCPTRFVPSSISKTYYSEILKDKNTLRENVVRLSPEKLKDQNIKVKTNSYYESDGVFCSRNCRKAYLEDNKHNHLYDDSEQLIKIIEDGDDVVPAPHWRMLKEYGGKLTIEEFRESFSNVQYESRGVYKAISHMFEEKIRL